MTVFKFRVLIDSKDDIFRDIEISSEQTLQDLYDCILTAFEFKGGQMASFYMSNDEWEKGKEYTLLDMSDKGDSPDIMSKVVLNDIIEEENQKILLVHDFLRMWCFYLELQEEHPALKNIKYPRVVLKFGDAPEEESKEIADYALMGDIDGIGNDFDFDDEEDGDMENDDEIGDMFNEMEGKDDY